MLYPPLFLARQSSRFDHPPPRCTPLHWTCSLPRTPSRLCLPRPRLACPLTPTTFPPLLPPPFLVLLSVISPSVPTTADTLARLAAGWPARIGPELAALQYIAQPYYASGELISVSPPFPPLSLPLPAAGISSSCYSFAAVVSL